jgi:uncharacterized protein YgbK (DUF1537 family)
VLPRPFVVVVGSQDPVTLMQVAQLRAEVPAARWIPAPDGVVPALSAPGAGLTILQAVAGPGADGPTVAARLARGLAGLVCGGQHTLVLTGGDTAAACLAAMDIGVLQLLGEALPCLPVSLPLDFPAGLIIVTRSGGFGDPDCLVQLWRDSRTAETADR